MYVVAKIMFTFCDVLNEAKQKTQTLKSAQYRLESSLIGKLVIKKEFNTSLSVFTKKGLKTVLLENCCIL